MQLMSLGIQGRESSHPPHLVGAVEADEVGELKQK